MSKKNKNNNHKYIFETNNNVPNSHITYYYHRRVPIFFIP